MRTKTMQELNLRELDDDSLQDLAEMALRWDDDDHLRLCFEEMKRRKADEQ